ncbi:hypothetical protein D0859_04664 [Hortaea werneckii]|uniref:Cytochrome P450 n=1 Tax=Hortaea werneckii TaxID=91943 RepID=A0A3M7J0X4_HORWE|nr:hypothetical protein D0859_04664 [Hortaea werneckii]
MYILLAGLHAIGGCLSWLVDGFGYFIAFLVSLFSSLLQTKSHCTTVPSPPQRLQSEIPTFFSSCAKLKYDNTVALPDSRSSPYLSPGGRTMWLLRLIWSMQVLVDVHSHLNSPSDGNVTLLWKHIRTEFSTAVARAFWGARHPFCHDPTVYWAAMEDFEEDALNLPTLRGQGLLQALKDYTERDGFEDSASFIKCQYDACHDSGTSIMSNGGLGLAFSAIGPITSTPFWMVCYIFSRPDLLAKVRAEVDSCLNVDEDRSHGQSSWSCTIDTAALNRCCPTLFTCLVEVLRLSSTQPTFRIVQDDATLVDPTSGVSYELKKNDVITLISAGMLDASELWGSDHENFCPERFGDAASQQIPKRFDVTQPYWMSQAQRAAFVPWGSGVHMCAGRFFAQEAILASTTLYVSAYDITDLQGRPFTAPLMSRKLSVSNAKPASDVEVCFRPRHGLTNVQYDYKEAQSI